MAEFAYIAKDRRGQSLEGVVEAASRQNASSQLRDRGWVVISIKSNNSRFTNGILSDSDASEARWWRIRSVHVELSLQQLALMVRSGMTLLASIDSCAKQTSSVALRSIWKQVARDIQSGQGLSQALSAHRCFPEFVIQLIVVGEKTGNLEDVFRRAADHLRNRRSAREEFWSATIYPALVVTLAVGVTIYMIIYLIPKLDIYLQSLGKQMPAMTQGLINATVWLTDNFAYLGLGAVLIATIVIATYLSNEGRKWIDQHLLRIPLIGRLIALIETSTFARTLSMMLASGITLTEGLATTQGLIRNRHLSLLIGRAKDKIMRGSNLSEAINDRVGFTPMLTQMTVIGQQSGELATVLAEVADLHENQFRGLIKRLNSMLTPVLTLLIGGIVGYVYVAFFAALFAAGS